MLNYIQTCSGRMTFGTLTIWWWWCWTFDTGTLFNWSCSKFTPWPFIFLPIYVSVEKMAPLSSSSETFLEAMAPWISPSWPCHWLGRLPVQVRQRAFGIRQAVLWLQIAMNQHLHFSLVYASTSYLHVWFNISDSKILAYKNILAPKISQSIYGSF